MVLKIRLIMTLIQSDSQNLFNKIKINILANFYQNTTFLLCEKKTNLSSHIEAPHYHPLSEDDVAYYTILNDKIRVLLLSETVLNNQSNSKPYQGSQNIEPKSFNPNSYNPYQATYLGQSIYHLYTHDTINEMRDFFMLALNEVCDKLELTLINQTQKDEINEVNRDEVLFKSINHHDIENSLGLEGNNQIRHLAYQNRYQKAVFLIENIASLSPLNQKLTQNLFNHLDLLIRNNNFLTAINAYYISNHEVPKYLFDNQKVYQTNDLHRFIKRKMQEFDIQNTMFDKMSSLRLVVNNT
jgi:hypothetical protein